jgi:2-C-methyl-D-erythritol 4-phosphate cytidylyltransferase
MLGLIVLTADAGAGLPTRSLLDQLLGAPLLARGIAGGLPTDEAVTGVVVVPADLVDTVRTDVIERFGLDEIDRVVAGGADRKSALLAGLSALPSDVDVVVVQEGARVLTPVGLVDAVVKAARAADAGIAAIVSADLIGADENGTLIPLDSRPNLRVLQGPAAYKVAVLKSALETHIDEDEDEAEAVAKAGGTVTLVQGDEDNRLLRNGADVSRALEVFSRRAADYAFVYPSDLLPDDPLHTALDAGEAKRSDA